MEISSTIQVTEDDIDLFNHMNYKRYIEHFESERAEWFQRLGIPFSKMAEKNRAVVILKLETTYLKEARLGEQLMIKTWPEKIGTKSFSLKQVIYNESYEEITASLCTMVMFDTSTRQSMPVIDEIARQFHKAKIT